MDKLRHLKLPFFLAAFSLLMIPAFAQGDQEGPRKASFTGSQITWQAQGGNGWVSVTVTGPGEYAFTAEFPPGQIPIFRAQDPDGNPLPDGTYNYEIKERPGNAKVRPENDPQGLPTKSRGSSKNITQSGTFSVLNGSIVDPNVQESSSGKSASGVSTNAVSDGTITTKDIVYVDDVIVDGSLCVGQDCVNGENFGFDTIRLKENNTRIKFDDTSNSGSFPNFDWELTANDSANGGANRFSIADTTSGRIPFTVEGSAPNHSLYVDDGGRLGFGTSTPVVELHTVDGDTPTLRLQQDGSSGFTPQTWDVAGNESGFFVRDATNGSKLSFRIQPNSPSASIFIKPDGVYLAKASVGNGPMVAKHLMVTETLDFTQSGTGVCEQRLVTVTGAVEGDSVAIGLTTNLANENPNSVYFGWVSAADSVVVRRCPIAGDATDPPSSTVRISVWNYGTPQ